MKPLAWSYSALTLYEQCPKRYYEERVAKSVPYEPNGAAQAGTLYHKAFENRLLKGTKLPMDIAHHEKMLAKLENAEGEILGEQKMAINRYFEPTGYFDKDVWVRGQADITILRLDDAKPVAFVGDYKFVRMHAADKLGRYDQLDLMCALIHAYYPEIEGYTGAYYWAKEKKWDAKRLIAADIQGVWNEFLPRIAVYEEAFSTMEYPAKENFLCKNWCPITKCVHNGKN